MAPTASMLFLSYHQLHRPAASVDAAPPSSRTKEEQGSNDAAGGGCRVRVSLSSALSLFVRRTEPTAAAAATVKKETRRGGGGVAGDGDREEPEAASLESRFEEAVRLSCWSS